MRFADHLLATVDRLSPPRIAHAHCDLPCGVYDPAQARIEAESVKGAMQKYNDSDDHDFQTRAIIIKEERADLVKHHLWVLWTDYFKPEHLEKYPAAARSLLEGHEEGRRDEEDHRRGRGRRSPGSDRRDRQDLLGDQEVEPGSISPGHKSAEFPRVTRPVDPHPSPPGNLSTTSWHAGHQWSAT